MGVTLGELIKQIDSRNIKLVAGYKGLGNMVEWAHMVDNSEIASFLVGGEVAFTTGIGISDNMTLLDLVESVYKQHASGMVINIGPYIDKIDQEIIQYGNAHDFPIFEVPWRVHMADIMRMFCGTITLSDQRAIELSALFKNAIFTPKMEELYIPVLMQKGYYTEWNYVVSVIDICDCVDKDEEQIQYVPVSAERSAILEKIIESRIVSYKYDAVMFRDQDKLLVILSDVTEEEAYEIIRTTCEQIYDELNGSNLVETLECYMFHNGSVQDTAEELYVHRNTVNYKLKKIESILDVSLTQFDVRNQLMTGLLVMKMRNLK